MAVSKNILREVYEEVYPVDGIYVNRERHYPGERYFYRNIIVNDSKVGRKDDEWVRVVGYYLHSLTRFATFIGLPNRMLDRMLDVNKKQSWENLAKNLAKNFIGWQGNVSNFKKFINILFMPVVILLNLISMPLKFSINILKLGTEFLPLLLVKGLELAAKRTEKLRNPGARLLNGFLVFLGVIAQVTYFFGRTITSPFENIKTAWKTGKTFGPGPAVLLSPILAGASILFSIWAYTVLFPLAAKVIAAKVLPILATHLPVMMTNTASLIAKTITPVLTAIGNVSIGESSSAAIRGLAMVVGFGLPTIVNALHQFVSMISNKWRCQIENSTDYHPPSDGDVDANQKAMRQHQNVREREQAKDALDMLTNKNMLTNNKAPLDPNHEVPLLDPEEENTKFLNSPSSRSTSTSSIQDKPLPPGPVTGSASSQNWSTLFQQSSSSELNHSESMPDLNASPTLTEEELDESRSTASVYTQ